MPRFASLGLILIATLGLAVGCDSGPDEPEACEEGTLQVEDITVGGGTVVTATSTVTVDYVGRLEDGTVFEERMEARFNLGRSVVGFREGLVGMREGGRRLLAIPPNLAYGPRGARDGNGNVIVPPCATLTFDVTLRGVE